MAKAASPVRLQEELMQAARSAGQRWHRSAAEQIEYWASLGRSVAASVDPDKLLAVSAGLARIRVEPVDAAPIDPDAVFAGLEGDRSSGQLSNLVSSTGVARYQAAASYPGLLEQVAPDGTVTLGQFSNGVFTPMEDSAG